MSKAKARQLSAAGPFVCVLCHRVNIKSVNILSTFALKNRPVNRMSTFTSGYNRLLFEKQKTGNTA